MLTQKNQSARVTAYYTSGGIAKPGLSPTVDVYDSSGLILSGQASTEVGGGFYDYVLPSGSTPNAGNYKFLFKTTDTSVDQRHVPGLWIIGEQWVENVNATVSSRSSHSAADIWAVGTRTLTGFGTLVADIATAVWGAATRTLSAFGFNVTVATNNDKTGYALTSAYDPAKTAAQGVDMAEVLATVGTIDGTTSLIDGKVDTLQTSVNGLNDISQADVAAAISAADLATGADADAIAAGITSLLAKVGGVTGSGANTLLGILKALASKAATAPSDIGGTFDPATDSLEAIRDRGDAAWTGGGGDPWSTPLPGAYNPGEAGHILGTNLDAKISTLYLGQTSSGSSSPLGSKSCTVQQSLDQGEKKALKGQLVASTGTITISSATVTLQRKGSETPVYGVDDVAATGYDAGAISTVQAWFLLDTVEPTTGEGPMAVGDYILVFKITATASTDGLEQVIKVKVPVKVTTIV